MRKFVVRIAGALALAAMASVANAAVYPPQQQLPATTIDPSRAIRHNCCSNIRKAAPD